MTSHSGSHDPILTLASHQHTPKDIHHLLVPLLQMLVEDLVAWSQIPVCVHITVTNSNHLLLSSYGLNIKYFTYNTAHVHTHINVHTQCAHTYTHI